MIRNVLDKQPEQIYCKIEEECFNLFIGSLESWIQYKCGNMDVCEAGDNIPEATHSIRG